jgi:endonuclease/exonuclease/phosphatase (EEP) superfamily protein YafD
MHPRSSDGSGGSAGQDARPGRPAAAAARLLAAVPLALTLMPLSSTGRGWVRMWDFPRAHIAGLTVVAGAAMHQWATRKPADRVLTGALAAALLYQVAKIVPYTPLYRRQVPSARNAPAEASVRLFVANVLQENRRSDLVLRAIRGAAPDVICLVETDARWARELAPLERDYRWVVRCPLENHYGMLLYSRLPLTACDTRFVVSEDVPSIRAVVQLRSGDEVTLYVVHPPPPLPGSPSYGRDAELVLTGREIAEHGKPAIVVGDLNDVAWSYTAQLFQRVSHMVDPRVGRGMFNTFHAEHPLARYPLDHVFHTRDFTLKSLRRLPYTGSDHFPIVAELAFSPSRKHEVPRPEPSPANLADAAEMVEDAREARPYVDENGEGQVTRPPS